MKSHPLKQERELRGWSLQKVADTLGITSRTVSRWEHGIAVPYPHYREQLCILYGKNARELGLLPQESAEPVEETTLPQPQPLAPLSPEHELNLFDPMLPPLGALGLIGRDDLLQQLKQRLRAGGNLALSAINGLPGIGKTALAVALASDAEVQAQFYDGILWAGLGTTPNIIGLLARWGTLLGVSPTEIGNTDSLQDWGLALRAAIGKRHMLLVIDDVWQLEAALALQVGGPYCACLITTRFPQIAYSFATEGAMEVPELSDGDGLALLARFAPELVAQEPEQALTLVRSVGSLPLALKLMGKYLATQAYHGHPRRLQKALVELHDAEQRLHLNMAVHFAERSPNLPTNISLSLHAAIDVSNQHLSPQAREALYALSVFPAKPQSFSEDAALAITGMPEEVLDELSDTGLLETSRSGRYSLHQTIADYAHTQLTGTTALERLAAYGIEYAERRAKDAEALEQENGIILAALHAAYTLGQHDALGRGVCAIAYFLQMHGVYTLTRYHLLENYQSTTPLRDAPGVTSPLLRLGKIMQRWGNDAQIETYLQEGLALARVSDDHKRAVALLTSLGWLASEQGNYMQAEMYYQEGLALVRQTGDRNRIRALFAGLGWIAEKRGDCEQAEAYLQEEIRLAREDGDHSQLSVLLTSLGWVVSKLGHYEQAKAYLQEGLALAHEVGDPDMPSSIFNCLACIALDWGDYALAENYAQQGLLLARQLGNQEIAGVLIGALGWIMERQRNYTQAEAYYQEGLALTRQIGHRELQAWYLAGLGWIAYKRKNDEQAEVYLQEALVLARQLSHHELLFRLVTILGRIAEKRGDDMQAEAFLQEGLEMMRRREYRSMEQRQHICNALYRLGELHLKQGKIDMAQATFQEMFASMPEGNRDVQARALYGLARCMAIQGNPGEARKLGEASFAQLEGLGHPDVGNVKAWLKSL
jgi:tetratricopeptide (TPR) repeat protein/transcriptional regulator with XRE-family HTH domain